MWKVLLCEDEPVVREALVEQIPWEEFGFSLIAQADNGSEALDLICRLQPDLVITDIVMPEMDGIELLQKAKMLSDARFVMLTCMNDFDYVRLALENGASGYLLKLSADEKALREMLRKLDKELKERFLHKGSGEPFRFQQEYKALWDHLISNGDAESCRAEPVYLHRLHELYPHAEVRVLAPSCREPAEKLEEKWTQLLPSHSLIHHVELQGVRTFFLWTASPAGASALQQEPEPGISMSIAEQGGSSYQELMRMWRRILLEWNSRWYGGSRTEERGCRDEASAAPASAWSLAWSEEKLWIRCLDAKDREGLWRLMDEIWLKMMEDSVWFFQVKITADRLLALVVHVWARTAPSPAEEDNSGANDHMDLKRKLERQLDSFLGELHQEKLTDTGREEINRVMEYVQLHLKEDISLRSMAHYVNLDERYLSTLFSRQTGETFINYLQQARVDKAVALLLETDLTIREIGEQAGFANENYFFRIFKRRTGETPAQYRRSKK